MWLTAETGQLSLLCLHPGPHVQQQYIGGSRSFVSSKVGALAPVISGALTLFPVKAPYPALAPRPQMVMLRPPRPPWTTQFIWRATTIFGFTARIYVMSLATVAISCAMLAQSLAVAVAKFVMASNVSYWRYPLSGLRWRCEWNRRGHPSRFEAKGATPCGRRQKHFDTGKCFFSLRSIA